MFKIFQVNSWSLLKVVQILFIFGAAYLIFSVTVCGEIWQTMSGCGSVWGGCWWIQLCVANMMVAACLEGGESEDVAGLCFGCCGWMDIVFIL